MKKLKKILLTFVIAAVAVAFFAACGNDRQPAFGTMTLVIGVETPIVYTVDLDNIEITEGALSVLAYLKETEGLEYTVETSTYGAYLTKVGPLEQDWVTDTYLYIYTSVAADFDVSAYAMTVEYDGKTLTSSGLGISEMTVESDCVIYIGTIVF